MKRWFLGVLITLTLGFVSFTSARSFTFSDDFNSSLSAEWLLGPNQFGAYGNWRIENGMLRQDQFG